MDVKTATVYDELAIVAKCAFGIGAASLHCYPPNNRHSTFDIRIEFQSERDYTLFRDWLESSGRSGVQLHNVGFVLFLYLRPESL